VAPTALRSRTNDAAMVGYRRSDEMGGLVERRTARLRLVLLIAVLLGGCTDPGRLAVTSPSPSPPPDMTAGAGHTSASEPAEVLPNLTREVAWQMSAAGDEVMHSAFGGLTISLGQLTLTDVDRYCPDGRQSPAPVCAGLHDDTRTVMAVDAVVRNESGFRLTVRPDASTVVFDDRRLPASVFAGSAGPTYVNDDAVEGQLQWLLPASVDDLRDRGGVELHVAVPPIRGATESRNQMVVFVII